MAIRLTRRDTIGNTAYAANLIAIQNTEIRRRRIFLTILIDKGRQVAKGQALFQFSHGELASDESKQEAIWTWPLCNTSKIRKM